MPDQNVHIYCVRTDAQAACVRPLAWEFIAFLRQRYPEMQQKIDGYLVSQNFAHQLDNLLAFFTPPEGECLLATLDGAPAGILMLKPAGPGVCEMNRMFVRATARRRGIGRKLCERIIGRARDLGYERMKLGALHRHDEALPLYRSLGFLPDTESEDFGDAFVVPMVLDLRRGAAAR